MTLAKGGWRDITTGAIVLVVGVVLFAMVYASGGKGEYAAKGYRLVARFHKADGISVGSDVRLSGVRVGKVVAETLDDQFRAVLTLQLADNVQLTADTAAVIHTDGLLGAKYVDLKPGGEDAVLKPGQEIPYTQDALVIEDLLEMIIAQGRAKRGITKPAPSVTE